MTGMKRIGAFLEIVKALNKEDIWFLNLKGPLLSQRIYNDPIYRFFRDFDILVKPEDVNRTIQILQKNGYQFPEFEWPKDEKKQQIALHFINQIAMVHQQSGVMLEVHWKLFSTEITYPQTIERLFNENLETAEFGGLTMNRLSLEFELFYLVVHGGVHAWFRLKWLVDIHEILHRKTIDWEKFHLIISKSNAQKLVVICNKMLQEYFPDGSQIPGASSASDSLAKVALEQCRKPEGDPEASWANTIRLISYRMKLFPSFRYKVDVSKILTFCKTDLKYDWLPPYKFVYYLFRPFGYFLRGIGILR